MSTQRQLETLNLLDARSRDLSKSNDDRTAHLDQMDSDDSYLDDNEEEPSSKSYHDFDDDDDTPTLVPSSIFWGGSGDDSSDDHDDKGDVERSVPPTPRNIP
jgi:hypothetical protein